MSTSPHADGIQSNKKVPSQLDDALTELTKVLKAMGIVELNFDEEQHYHLTDEDAKPDAASLKTFSALVRQMYNEIVSKKA